MQNFWFCHHEVACDIWMVHTIVHSLCHVLLPRLQHTARWWRNPMDMCWIYLKIHNPYPNLTKASELLYPFPIHPIDILTRVEVYHKFKEHIIGCVIACPNLCCFNLLTTNTPVFRRWSVLQLHLLCFSTDTQVCFSTFAKIKANSLLSAQILELSS